MTTPTATNANTLNGFTNELWAALVLKDLGVPISANNMAFMSQWMASENGVGTWTGTAGANNPLNNGYSTGGGAGLGSNPDLTVAAANVAGELHSMSAFDPVISNLKASAPPSTTAASMWASPWAGGHYGNGSAWSSDSNFGGGVSAAASALAGATKGVSVGTGVTIKDLQDIVAKQEFGNNTGEAGAASQVEGALSGAAGLETAAIALIGDVTNATFWERVGTGALGIFLVIFGTALFFEGSKTGQKITSDAVQGAATAAVA